MGHSRLRVLGGLGVAAIVAISVARYEGRPRTRNVNGVAWFDSFEDARRKASPENKPVLLLSMFGRIDEDMPCANARTLRATLFKSDWFKSQTADAIVPAWEMVRAVPRVTIDLGDGKRIVRTVRGNAVMYLCRADGRVVDAFPGVYTEKDFVPQFEEALKHVGSTDAELVAWHRSRGGFPASRLTTLSKSGVESPTLSLMGAARIAGATVPPKTNRTPEERMFDRAAQTLVDVSLTPASSLTLIPALTGRQPGQETPERLGQMILEADSANNLRSVRPVVHLYLAACPKPPTPLEARDAILVDMLKIPYKDPYFGLKDALAPGTP